MAAAFPRQPQDHVAVVFAGSAQRAQPIEDIARQPDQPLAVLVHLVLEAHVAKRQCSGYRVKGGLGDGNADHAAQGYTDLVGSALGR